MNILICIFTLSVQFTFNIHHIFLMCNSIRIKKLDNSIFSTKKIHIYKIKKKF